MSTLIEAVIALIALINHLSCGTTFVGIRNRLWRWLRVAAHFAGAKKENYIIALKQLDLSVNTCILTKREGHGKTKEEPWPQQLWLLWGEFRLSKSSFPRSDKSLWRIGLTEARSSLTEGAQLYDNDVAHKGEVVRNNYRQSNLLPYIRSRK